MSNIRRARRMRIKFLTENKKARAAYTRIKLMRKGKKAPLV